MSGHTLVLLGDSVLDNWPYTRPMPDTTAHLERLLGAEWSVRRLAQDGATMADLPSQLRRLPARPTHAVVSIGGNDAIAHIGVLGRQATSAAELLGELLAIADEFAQRYEAAVRALAERAGYLLLCTIYDAPLEPPILGRVARAPLGLLNDRIIRTAAYLGLDVLEMRSVCTRPDDFVLQIEPSHQGAAKIAQAIARILRDGGGPHSARVFAAEEWAPA